MFQVFCLTVVFGLFHGLVLLPVVLSILGPSHPSSSDAASDQASDAASIKTGSVSAGSSRSESPERQIKSQDIMEAQWTIPV